MFHFSKNLFYASTALLLMLAACNNEPNTKQQSTVPVVYKQVSPNFNADSAYYFIKTQVDFGSRVTNSVAHKKCGDWLVNELNKYADNVIEQKTIITHFDGTKLNVRNIIAEINTKATNRILLCAHWDSRDRADKDVVDKDKPILGANDGASGVGVLLEIARILKSNPIDIGVDIILFDAEDLGNNFRGNTYCLGSQYWSVNLHRPRYKADFGILLDMVGASNVVFNWEANSVAKAKQVLEKVWGVAHNLNYGKHFAFVEVGGIDDDHVYVNQAGIPTINLIDFNAAGNFPEHHHTHRDNMNVIDRNSLKAVGQTVLETIYTYK